MSLAAKLDGAKEQEDPRISAVRGNSPWGKQRWLAQRSLQHSLVCNTLPNLVSLTLCMGGR